MRWDPLALHNSKELLYEFNVIIGLISQSFDRKADFHDPLLASAVKPENLRAVVHPHALGTLPILCFGVVHFDDMLSQKQITERERERERREK
jgi:hypothetical protein